MAFAGNAGAAAGPIAVATIAVHPLGALTYDTDGRTAIVTGQAALGNAGYRAGGIAGAGQPDQLLRSLYLDITQNALTGFIDATKTGAATDTGILTTLAAAVPANEHGIPTNFGPGAGNWEASDLFRLKAVIQAKVMVPLAGDGSVYIDTIALTGAPPADIQIIFKNLSADLVAALTVALHYDHSLEV